MELPSDDDFDEGNVKYETDIEEEIEGNIYAKQNEKCVTSAHSTAMHNLNGPNIDSKHCSCRELDSCITHN